MDKIIELLKALNDEAYIDKEDIEKEEFFDIDFNIPGAVDYEIE